VTVRRAIAFGVLPVTSDPTPGVLLASAMLSDRSKAKIVSSSMVGLLLVFEAIDASSTTTPPTPSVTNSTRATKLANTDLKKLRMGK
jgi:hypothetical protein